MENISDEYIWSNQWLSSSVKNELKTLKYPRVREEIEIYTKFLPKRGRVLEAGCGLGRWVLYFRHHGYDIIGVDWSRKAIDQIKAFDNSAPVQVADVQSLPFTDGHFRGVLSFGVIEHFVDGPEPVLREMNRVLEKKGILILTVPLRNLGKKLSSSCSCILPGFSSKEGLGQASKRRDDLFENPLRFRDLSSTLQAQGFEIVFSKPIGHSFTLWDCSSLFRRRKRYYRETRAAEIIGCLLSRFAAWSMAHSVLIVGEKK